VENPKVDRLAAASSRKLDVRMKAPQMTCGAYRSAR
jgi:hypothetical protein